MTASLAQGVTSKLPLKLPSKHRPAVRASHVATPSPSATPMTDGKVQETFANGKPHVIREYQSGQLLSEVVFREAGALQTKKIYDQGRLVSDDTFYENGSLQKSIRRSLGSNGVVEIKIETFFENGKPSVEGGALANSFTEEGRREGPYQSWNEKGAVLQTGQFRAGEKTGTWKLNLENAFRTEIYEAGHLKRRIDLDVRTKKVIADDRYSGDGSLEMPVGPLSSKAGSASGK